MLSATKGPAIFAEAYRTKALPDSGLATLVRGAEWPAN
jgi:hypothetical protein